MRSARRAVIPLQQCPPPADFSPTRLEDEERDRRRDEKEKDKDREAEEALAAGVQLKGKKGQETVAVPKKAAKVEPSTAPAVEGGPFECDAEVVAVVVSACEGSEAGDVGGSPWGPLQGSVVGVPPVGRGLCANGRIGGVSI